MFKLEIDIGNDAMQTAHDLAGALRRAADAVEQGQTDGRLRDENGNTVGTWIWES